LQVQVGSLAATSRHLGHSYSSERYSVCGKRPLAIAAVNAELPPFKNGEHNSESVSTICRVINSNGIAFTFYATHLSKRPSTLDLVSFASIEIN